MKKTFTKSVIAVTVGALTLSVHASALSALPTQFSAGTSELQTTSLSTSLSLSSSLQPMLYAL